MNAAIQTLFNETKAHFSRSRSPNTLEKYGRIVRKAGTCDLVKFVQGAPIGQFILTRSAVVHGIWSKILKLLKDAFALLKIGEHGEARTLFTSALSIRALLDQIKQLEPPEGEFKRKGKSKRGGLGKLPADWVQSLIAQVPERSLPAVLVSILAGCRPKELEAGIEVTISGDARVTLTIHGAKVTESSGQPWRVLFIDTKGSAPARQLWQIASNSGGTLFVQRKPRTFHKCLAVASRKAGLPPISSYTSRHWFASALKRDWSSDKVRIARALGHASTATQKLYGSKQQGRRGGHAVDDVRAARKVREPHRPHPNAVGNARPEKVGVAVAASPEFDFGL